MELPLTPAEKPAAKRKPKPVLTLRPSRERTRRPLAAGLLIPNSPGADHALADHALAADAEAAVAEPAGGGPGRIVGPRHLRASELPASVGPGDQADDQAADGQAADGRESVVAALDVHPDALPQAVGVDVLRYVLNVPGASPAEIDEALELEAPGRVALSIGSRDGDAGLSLRECAERAVAAGRSLVLPADASADDVADFHSNFTHSDAGYFARADDAQGVVRVLACAVAGITGFDVRAAYRGPDVDRLLSLTDLAADSVRELLLGVFVPDPVAVAGDLVGLGFAAGEHAGPAEDQRS